LFDTLAWITTYSVAITTLASSGAVIGIWFAFMQLRLTRKIAQLQFEDGLSKEYRDLANRIPTKALLGHSLSDEEYEKSFDEIFRYMDLSNEQINLRSRKRISLSVWNEWLAGIAANLQMPTFSKAWDEIKNQSSLFQELRRLEAEQFRSDPAKWKKNSNSSNRAIHITEP